MFNRSTLALALAVAGLANTAQAAPGAGALLRDTSPATHIPTRTQAGVSTPGTPAVVPASHGVKFTVHGFKIEGAHVFTADRLQRVIASSVGRRLDLAGIRRQAARITRFYRNRGYLLSQAYIPPQRIQGGRVTIKIVEGGLARVDTDNRANAGSEALAPLQKIPTGAPLQAGALNRALLLINDEPGLAIHSVLKPGRAAGTADLETRVTRTARISGSVQVDNFGSRAAGSGEMRADVDLNDPLSMGDRLALTGLISDGGLYYAHADYQLPIDAAGTTAGIGYGHLYYKLGQPYRRLDASGTADNVSVWLKQPFVRSQNFNLFGRAEFDQKKLDDRIGVAHRDTHTQIRVETAGLEDDWQDGWLSGGSNVFYARATVGSVEGNGRPGISRHFTRYQFGAIRLQRLANNWSLKLAYRGQWTPDNLAAVEQMPIGGENAVKGFPRGYVGADRASLFSGTLNYRLPVHTLGIWQASAFYEHVFATLRARGAKANDHRSLGSAGVGLNLTLRQHLKFDASVAFRTSGQAPAPATNKTPRFLLSMSYQF